MRRHRTTTKPGWWCHVDETTSNLQCAPAKVSTRYEANLTFSSTVNSGFNRTVCVCVYVRPTACALQTLSWENILQKFVIENVKHNTIHSQCLMNWSYWWVRYNDPKMNTHDAEYAVCQHRILIAGKIYVWLTCTHGKLWVMRRTDCF